MMLKKIFATLSSATMVLVGLVALPAVPAVAAPPATAFDPGLIISDSVFFDFASMDLGEIQAFLDSKVENCRATDPALDCLKSYLSDIPEVAATLPTEVGPCLAISAKSGATAAEVIYTIANACGISPKVLLTTLQKEQGLITSTKPTDYMYRAAMGFGCPDSDPGICGKVYTGLFNQLYRAAKQFRWYGNPEGSFTYWKPGRTVSMRYNPKSTCGTKSVALKSQATANLYYYTPYTPNDAALSNMYGTGDSCSAYGNRNFWRFYHDWFGSPIGGGYLLRAEGSSETYLIVDSLKYLVSDARMIAALMPLGPIGEISRGYLDSFVTTGNMTQLVKQSDTGDYYLLVDGVRYLTDCTTALEFGLSCDLATSILPPQINLFVDGGTLTRFIQAGDSRYWVEKGQSRIVVDELALSTVGATSMTPTKLTIEQVTSLSAGPALASELVMFGIKNSGDVIIASSGSAYRFTASLIGATGLTKWFTTSNAVVDVAVIAPSISTSTVRGFVAAETGKTYVLTADGKLEVTDPSEWTEEIVTLPDSMLNQIPDVVGTLATPAMVTSAGNKLSYFVEAGERRISKTADMTTEFLKLLDQPKAVVLPQAAINTVPNIGTAIAPGTIIKASGTSTLYLADDLTRKVKLASESQAKSVSDSKIFSFTKTELAALQTRTGFTSIKVQCGADAYLLDGGTLYPVAPEAAANYPGTPYPLAVSTCAGLNVSTRAVGQFLRDNKGVLYLVVDGKKSRIKSWAHYATLVGDGPGYIKASAYFSSKIPTSGTAPATIQLASTEGTPSGVFDEVSFTGSVPEVIAPTPTPTPTPTATPTPAASSTPSPTPSATAVATNPATYKVVSGDTLNAIASRFKVSVADLQSLNNISDPRLLRIGQVLKIPGSVSTATPTPSPTPTPTPTPTKSPSPEPEAVEVTYVVQSGDTLYKIASKFGVSVNSLQSYNSISNAAYIKVGQVLKIPTSTSASNAVVVTSSEPEVVAEPVLKTYKVVSGDTLWGIARKLGVSATSLAEANSITNANLIRIGQVLKVPN